ncbi:MAG: hypothetical protein CMB12_06975 [Euryarchaeota archaeon]|nr:hypothetical protein [Euryarchaeota archaeon]|tara:strand:- start:942 stop:2201 length:1260 start_codon:yes stop_codon:yes gene_type:complete
MGMVKLGEVMNYPRFFPALAHTDILPYASGSKRKLMSIRRLFPPEIQRRFLISLSFDEEIHYQTNETYGDQAGLREYDKGLREPEEVFVDCGAFHYKDMEIPRLNRGTVVTPTGTIRHYQKRHYDRSDDTTFFLCSPDHIIRKDMDEDESKERTEWTLNQAEEFIQLSKEKLPSAKPVGVVHGRNMEERLSMMESMIDVGFNNVAFGGLVPLAGDKSEVLQQVAGIDSTSSGEIPYSPLHLAKSEGCSVHMLGLGSPDWYKIFLNLGIDSFDTAKLSQEGAKNGLIWEESKDLPDESNKPIKSNQLYSKSQTKKMGDVQWSNTDPRTPIFPQAPESESILDQNPVGGYFRKSICTSKKCRHGPDAHVQDPRMTGSAGHNMARTIINAHVFQSMMERMNNFCELSLTEDRFSDWAPMVLE